MSKSITNPARLVSIPGDLRRIMNRGMEQRKIFRDGAGIAGLTDR
jgi:hypothetical protein